VTYRLPGKTTEADSKAVFFTAVDERPTKDVMGSGAQREFGETQSVLSFAVAEGGGKGVEVGIFEVPVLVKEAFRRRLEQAGILILPDRGPGQIELCVAVRDFFLDLAERKWLFRMSYEARLLKDGKVLATQTISGNGERMKIFGKDQADEVVSEVFTDTLNQLNVGRLLDQARLL